MSHLIDMTRYLAFSRLTGINALVPELRLDGRGITLSDSSASDSVNSMRERYLK
jgi:hypothetical protein